MAKIATVAARPTTRVSVAVSVNAGLRRSARAAREIGTNGMCPPEDRPCRPPYDPRRPRFRCVGDREAVIEAARRRLASRVRGRRVPSCRWWHRDRGDRTCAAQASGLRLPTRQPHVDVPPVAHPPLTLTLRQPVACDPARDRRAGHRHVVDDEVECHVGDTPSRLRRDESVFVPRTVPHVWAAVSGAPATILDVYQPAGEMEALDRSARPAARA